jgi:cell division protein FtsI/penicillin-binding protein 2
VKETSFRTRVVVVASALAVAGLAVAARLADLQIIRADILRAQARRQHQQVIEIGGRRGSIVDREGRELAVSEASVQSSLDATTQWGARTNNEYSSVHTFIYANLTIDVAAEL